jgi:glycosyltransferase involved in cell wall biosynthesis
MREGGAANNLGIIIPIHNEEKNIASVITEVRRHFPEADIVVIDDGSTDRGASIALSKGAIVLNLSSNLGIGGAVQTGYRFAKEMNYDIVARLDGDGQHNPAHLSKLITLVETKIADVAIGSRFLAAKGYQASRLRMVGIRLFAMVTTFVTGQKFTDSTSGFQVMNKDAFVFLSRHMPADYPEIEGLLLLSRAGFRIHEVAVRMRPRAFGHSSITPLRSVYYVLKVLLAVFVELLRRPIHRNLP